MRLLLAGEGPTELGGWSAEPEWRDPVPARGVLEALLQKVQADGWQVSDARVWKRIRKYRSGDHRSPETRTILGLVLDAHENGHSLLVFSRDRDGDPEREEDVERGIAQARALFPEMLVVGGVACEETEAWILALLGERRSEQHRDPKAVLHQKHRIASTAAMVEVIDEASLDRLPSDADSLRVWLDRARQALRRPICAVSG